MMKWLLLSAFMVVLPQCGYKPIMWRDIPYRTIYIQEIKTLPEYAKHIAVFQGALQDRCLSMSGLSLSKDRMQSDLVLATDLQRVTETVIATDIDRRVRQVQFTLICSFKLATRQGKTLWELKNYRFSDQFEVSSARGEFRNDAAASYDSAFQNVSEMAVTHFSIALHRQEAERDQ